MSASKKIALRILPSGKVINVRKNYNLQQAILDGGINIESSCGGTGTCGKCRVKVISGHIVQEQNNSKAGRKNKDGFVLSCLSTVAGDSVIEIQPQRHKVKGKIDEGGFKPGIDKVYKSISRNELLPVEIKPWIEKFKISVEEPSIFYNTSDLYRLKRSLPDNLQQFIPEINIPIDVIRKIPDALRKNNWEATITYDRHSRSIINIQPGNTLDQCFGIAVDIGTTTLVLYLVDLATGDILDSASEYNPQIRYGEDIINRIVYSLKNDGLEKLSHILFDTMNAMISRLLKSANVSPENIVSVMVAGNPTMLHLFYGVSPRFIREMPYITAVNKFPVSVSKELGLKNIKNAMVHSIPGVSGYLGGDITSGVLAINMARKKELSLLLDLGTNGELVVGNSDWMMGCSCSAGPAFEGGGVKCGIRAVDGAIEKVSIEKDTLNCIIEVIGNNKPVGICGSGLIDLISEMFLKGVIDRRGKFEKSIENRHLKYIDDEYRYIVSYGKSNASGEDIFISEVDIENLVRAKAAVYAGIKTLLEEVDLKIENIDKIYIAGGLGKNINIKSAIIIGMFPDINTARYHFLGNTSITGSYLSLLSEDRFNMSEKIADSITYIDLSVNMKFMERYIAGIFLPNTELKDFPTVESVFYSQ
jgi:uncharacterized 2Fe-2S/4Fe-4S cluster protein (DUF4445 family)